MDEAVAGGLERSRGPGLVVNATGGMSMRPEESLALLDTVLAVAPVGLAFLDRELRFQRVNPALARMHNLPMEAYLGRSLLEVLPTFPAAVAQAMRRVLATGEPATGLEISAPDASLPASSRRHLLASYYPVRGDSGAIIGLATVVVDLSERRLAEEALRRAEEAQRFLAEAGAVLSSSLDYATTLARVAQLAVPHLADWCTVDLVEESGRIRPVAAAHVDAAKEALLRALQERYPLDLQALPGYARVVRTGQPLVFTNVPERRLRAMARDEEHLRLLRALRPRSGMCVALRARGHTLGLLSLVSTHPGRQYHAGDLALAQELARRAAIAVDNTRLYREARESEREARAFYQAALAIGGEFDLDARLQRVLDIALELAGAKQARVTLVTEDGTALETVAARGAQVHTLGVHQPLGAGLAGEVVARNRPVRSADMLDDPRTWNVDLARREGVRSWLGVPLADGARAFGVLAVLSEQPDYFGEAHERRLVSLAALAGAALREARLHRQAQEAVRARDEFLSVAAHELKTPITGLRGFAQLLARRLEREGRVDPDQLQRALRSIDQQSARLAQLVSHLLDVARIESGKLTIARSPTDLVGLVANVVANARATTSQHSLRLQAPAELWVLGDPLRLEQVVTNLVDNAIKYSPEGGPIEIDLVQPSPGLARLSVRDHGMGIPPERRGHIFDRFYQAHTANHASGMGLGLYISRQIVELHGGEIRAEFPPDGGTRFVVTVPCGLEELRSFPTERA